jgi:hypothetical protein
MFRSAKFWTILAIKAKTDFLIFLLEYLKGVQNSIALNAQIYLITSAWEVSRRNAPAMLIFLIVRHE